MKINLPDCYALAWRSFSRRWIPLCLISGVIFIFQVIPQILVRPDMNEFRFIARRLLTAVMQKDKNNLEMLLPEAVMQLTGLAHKLVRFALYTFPFVALFTIILLLHANRAVKNKEETKRPFPLLLYISFMHVIEAVVKLSAFCFFILPGVYLYIKLLFVSLIMLEGNKGYWAAVKTSWKMTRGNFRELFLLVLINTGIQLLALPTIIGTIPATGFANTSRAAAFRILWEKVPASCE